MGGRITQQCWLHWPGMSTQPFPLQRNSSSFWLAHNWLCVKLNSSGFFCTNRPENTIIAHGLIKRRFQQVAIHPLLHIFICWFFNWEVSDLWYLFQIRCWAYVHLGPLTLLAPCLLLNLKYKGRQLCKDPRPPFVYMLYAEVWIQNTQAQFQHINYTEFDLIWRTF